MTSEKKYIIAKKYGKLIHLVFPYSLYHDTHARDNGLDVFNDVIETGQLIDGRAFIITCKDRAHAQRREYRQHLPAQSLQARTCQSIYLYKIPLQGD